MAKLPKTAKVPAVARGNYISEWFGHRMYPAVVASEQSLADQKTQRCPFLTSVKGQTTECIKSPASKGVCTINTLGAANSRRDWLACPYRSFDPELINDAVRRLFDYPIDQPATITPGTRLIDAATRADIVTALVSGGRVFVYFDEKLGGELSIKGTDRSPEFSLDITVIEIELKNGDPHLGRFGVIEIQTMDFHGSYKHAVGNLKNSLHLFPDDFPNQVQHNQHWLSDKVEGPNIANVFKRTFYQMMFKFQLGQNSRCAGCALAIPKSVWESWQRHLAAPALTLESDGTFSLFKPGQSRPAVVPAWIYVFDLDAVATTTPSPVFIPYIIATDAAAMAYYALEAAPAHALSTIDGPTGLLISIEERIDRYWPKLGRALTV